MKNGTRKSDVFIEREGGDYKSFLHRNLLLSPRVSFGSFWDASLFSEEYLIIVAKNKERGEENCTGEYFLLVEHLVNWGRYVGEIRTKKIYVLRALFLFRISGALLQSAPLFF
jgi:hypothetical protein